MSMDKVFLTLARIGAPLTRQTWFESARRSFWSNPDRLMAAKATLAISLLAVPMVLLGYPFFAVSLALGALAGALSETDDHPKGRIKSLALKVVSFGISSLSVELLRPYPVLLGLGLSLSTIGFLLIGGLSERYRGVTFGAILVGIYAMIGATISPAWYWQPILLPAGALFYGLFSLMLLFLHPWRLLEEQLARGYLALARYMELKAGLFPSDEKMQAGVRNQLALQNVKLVSALDRCKEVLNSYRDSLPDDEPLTPYLRYFMLLQSLHERAASSHERYDLLSGDPRNRELMEGIGQMLQQLAGATRQFANCLLAGVPYRHPVSLEWLVNVLNDQLAQSRITETSPLPLLVNNLARSHRSLQNLSDEQVRNIAPRLARDERPLVQRFRDQLSWNNPRMRYAVRLSLCFLAGFAISEMFDLRKGEWIILTCLFVLQPSYSETRRKLFQRILGTISGVVGGVLIVRLLTPTGQLIFMLTSAFLFFASLRKNYSVSVIFITTFVMCAFNLVSEQGVALMVPRLVDTLIGSGLAFLSVRLLWPDWQFRRLPGLLDEALGKNAAYFKAIILEYQRESAGDDLAYRIARREAHRGDNALVLAWQDMQLEPRNRRQFLDKAFELTYLNHALLSYLSAFGAHRQQQRAVIVDILPLAGEVLAALNDAAAASRGSRSIGNVEMPSLLESIRQRAHTSNESVLRQQFTLLYNIADVTGQITRASASIRISPERQ
ncbi:MAG TPA: YccS family putative transporter [Opitutales bacterium]|nr:YccS family putative transporter [Opitutales bacterium]